jgi:hypothetical protein
METRTFRQQDGRVYIKILNFHALQRMMKKKYGDGWKERCLTTYGSEQLYGPDGKKK